MSVALGLTAYLLALAVGIVAGTYAALHQNKRIDYVSMAIAMLGISIPNFVLGPTLVLLFGLTWYVLPPARWEGFGVYMIMPVLTLSAIYMAYIARLTRSGMLEVLRRTTSGRQGRKDCRNARFCGATRCAADCCRSSRSRVRRSRCC